MTVSDKHQLLLAVVVNLYVFFLCSTNWNAGLSISAGIITAVILYVYVFRKERIRQVPVKFFGSYAAFMGLVMLAAFLTGNKGNLKSAFSLVTYSIPMWLFYLTLSKYPDLLNKLWYGLIAGMWVLNGYGISQLAKFSLLERVHGPVASPNTFAMLLEVLVPLLFFEIRMYQRRQMRSRYLVSLFTGTVSVSLLLFSFSRGGIVGFCIGGIITFGISKIQENKFLNIKKLTGILLLAIMALTVLFFKAAISYNGRTYDGERKLLWIAAYHMWDDHKLYGVGLHEWNDVYQKQYILPGAKERNLTLPHNNIANFFSGAGLLGGGGYLLFSCCSFYFLLKSRRENPQNGFLLMMLWVFISFFIHGMVDNTMFGKYGLRLYFAAWGITLASLQNLRLDRSFRSCFNKKD